MTEVEDRWNAFVALPGKEVEPAGTGTLDGWRVAVKDDTDVEGLPTRSGSRLTSPEPVAGDAPLVSRLRSAGARIVGKTNLCEFGLFAVTDNALTGATRNPWDVARTPGGSSGGSAVAVATGLADAATGTDAGGSVRIPAAFCGVVGFKPSRGRVPHESGAVYGDRVQPGFLARSVDPVVELLETTQDAPGPVDPRDPRGVRAAWSRDLGFAAVDPEVGRVAEAATSALGDAGVSLEDVDVTLPDPGPTVAASTGVEARAFLEDRFPRWRDGVWRPTEALVDAAPGDAEAVREEMGQLRRVVNDRLEELYRRVDVLVTPTTAVPPFPSGQLGVDTVAGKDMGALGWMPFTVFHNLTGGPAASVPAGVTETGLPVGLQVAGAPGEDETVLGMARGLEEVLGWEGWMGSGDG